MFDPTTDYAAYAGIGSRDTPKEICDLMTGIARMLDERGYVLRSGGAGGADQAFDNGTSGMSQPEIYLPWNGFNGKVQRLWPTARQISAAMELARRYHPNWDACSEGAKKLHARNGFQILGLDLNDPVRFVICWTKNGKPEGGTGQALRIADDRDIPIYNLFHKEDRAVFYSHIGWDHE